ncbi:N-acetyltransferase [Sulfitobacter sp. S190]|uniref:GNAT family N-acetyltransferase n=1 Tax=Sulfitobacter sp. S190 TaxID=2867022 RepID=UPI0021A54A3B|nr:N-acetyltransferase [Sulfitobacter sp. S190]UWR21276.1 GNAT family N-acetyltransferase [Sulfitobacter sp. S190]
MLDAARWMKVCYARLMQAPKKPETSAIITPPLRPFRPDDAYTVARLNDMASGGLLFNTWEKAAGEDGDSWEQGRLQQIEQVNSGWVVIVLDQGNGVEAVLMGQPHATDSVPTDGVDPIWTPLMELENMVPGSWCLNVIATLPEFRGQGHAAVLMQQAEMLARDGHHPSLALVVADENVGAIRLYQKCGFSEFARRSMVKGDWDGPGEDWVLMVKPLSDS